MIDIIYLNDLLRLIIFTGIIGNMKPFNYFLPVQVRYGDIDAQAHVNNTRFVAYMEHARMSYLVHLGLWDGASFLDLGLIVADVHVAYKAPIKLWQHIRVGVQVTRMGNKSLDVAYEIQDEASGEVLATGETVMVAYDYRTERSIPIPAVWREKISAFEGL